VVRLAVQLAAEKFADEIEFVGGPSPEVLASSVRPVEPRKGPDAVR
jgi:hypothetical protein